MKPKQDANILLGFHIKTFELQITQRKMSKHLVQETDRYLLPLLDRRAVS